MKWRLTHLAAGFAAAAFSSFIAVTLPMPAAQAANAYPAPVIKLITHSSPGGGSDVYLRELLPYLQPYLGSTLVVENVTGGSGAKAMSFVASSKADGGTFYATTPTYIYT
ncbi:MAG TPA: hypothetical protein VN229_10255, partial [Terriglobales bacterium]|nr:hypothetical protein [Terriglobales bacterium]